MNGCWGCLALVIEETFITSGLILLAEISHMPPDFRVGGKEKLLYPCAQGRRKLDVSELQKTLPRWYWFFIVLLLLHHRKDER